MSYGPTQKQAELLRFLRTYSGDHGGVMPSYSEICVALSLTSKSGINRLMIGLEERGLIRRRPNMTRAVEIVDAATDALIGPTLDAAIREYAAATGDDPRAIVATAISEYLTNHPPKEIA